MLSDEQQLCVRLVCTEKLDQQKIKYKNLVDMKSSFRRTAGPLEAPVFFKVIYGQ